MPKKGSADKRQKQNESSRSRNRMARSEVRTACRSFLTVVESKDKAAASDQYKKVTKLIDTAARKGVFHKNTAARKKSRLYRAMTKIEA